MTSTPAYRRATFALQRSHPWGVKAWIFRAALIMATYLAAVHLAQVGEGGSALPDGRADDALSAPACVGCHQGGEDEQPGPDAGLLTAGERASVRAAWEALR